MKLMKRAVYVLLWLAHDKSGEYRPRSYIPKHEIEAIVRTFYHAVVAFFESAEGKLEYEEWRAKQEAEKNAKENTA